MQMKQLMNVKQVEDWVKEELSSFMNKEEIRHFSLQLFNHLRGYERKDLLMNFTSLVTQEEMSFISQALHRLKNNEPIQYIIGYTEFYGLKFKSDYRALIPRPETEELVDWILHSNSTEFMHILDVGTGSGCIAISLKKHLPESSISAWDISQEALELAEENAHLNGVVVDFQHQDILNRNIHLSDSLDLLVSNPPYVTRKEKRLMKPNVLDFEPHNALFVEDDAPLLFYEAIARMGREVLRIGGWLYFEINENQGAETEKLLNELGYSSIELKKDLYNRDRMIRAVWKG